MTSDDLIDDLYDSKWDVIFLVAMLRERIDEQKQSSNWARLSKEKIKMNNRHFFSLVIFIFIKI